MLKTTRLLDKQAFGKNNSSRFAFNRNNNSKLVFGRNIGNDKIDEFDIDRNSIKYTKKSEKSKSKKISKFWNLAKLEKKIVKKWEFN